MFKVSLFTISFFFLSCEKGPEQTRKSPTLIQKKAAVESKDIKKKIEQLEEEAAIDEPKATEKQLNKEARPKGLVPIPDELLEETKKSLNLDEDSANDLAKTLEQEIDQ